MQYTYTRNKQDRYLGGTCMHFGKTDKHGKAIVQVIGRGFCKCRKCGAYRGETLEFLTLWQSNVRERMAKQTRRSIYPKF